MNSPSPTGSSSPATTVNYDSGPVLELAIADVDYRVDAGKHGTALCISTRASGTWDWSFLGEARWDGSELRMRSLDRDIRIELSRALVQALESLD
jgi:hypothetical protein